MSWNRKKPYLCGTMSNLKDYGTGWRKEVTKWLKQYRIIAYDPCLEETKEHKKYDLTKIVKNNWEGIPQLLQEEIINKDLRQIRYFTNFIICFFTRYSTGTVSELSFALYFKIPVYFVTIRKLKGWPLTVANSEGNKIFKCFADLKRYLKIKYKLKKRA